MAEHVYADPKRKTPVVPTVEATDKQTAPPHVENNSLVDLQRVIGNQGLQRMLAQNKIQAKLTVGAADDVYEQEADRVAKDVMSNASTAESVQRAAPEEDELARKRADIQREAMPEDEELIGEEGVAQAKRADIQREAMPEDEEQAPDVLLKRADIQRADVDMSGSFDVDENVEGQISGMKGSGQALPSSTRGFMESGFGQDFGDVHVHTGSDSDALNRSIGARAFTHGSDIFLRSNEYNPDSSSGRELLAHELTHVVQQTGGKAQAKRSDECDGC
jgi:hypothetical protein